MATAASLPSGTKLNYSNNDHLGTPQVFTDQNQNVVWQADYQPFGEVSESVNIFANNLRFAGQYFDGESGLHYNYFRDYDPGTGRYVQSDPIGLDGGLNTYGYVDQNPLVYIDPFGLTPKGKRPKLAKNMCTMDCQTLQQSLIRLCKTTGFAFFACLAEVEQLVVDCMVRGGVDVPECKEEEPCEAK